MTIFDEIDGTPVWNGPATKEAIDNDNIREDSENYDNKYNDTVLLENREFERLVREAATATTVMDIVTAMLYAGINAHTILYALSLYNSNFYHDNPTPEELRTYINPEEGTINKKEK